jgi:opacity protein-like surface antigen
VHLDGTADWHPSEDVALGVQAQYWTLDTSWQAVLARATLSTATSDRGRLYLRGGLGAAFMHHDLDDSSTGVATGLAYAVSTGFLVKAGSAWRMDFELRYSHFQAAAETDPFGFVLEPKITTVSLGLGFDAVVW